MNAQNVQMQQNVPEIKQEPMQNAEQMKQQMQQNQMQMNQQQKQQGQQPQQHMPMQQPNMNQQYQAPQQRTPQEVYQTQLASLRELGFFDEQENINALQRTGGNVNAVFRNRISDEARPQAGSHLHSFWCVESCLPEGRYQAPGYCPGAG